MNPLFECIYSVNMLASAFKNASLSVQHTFELLNSTVYKSIQIMKELDRRITDFDTFLRNPVQDQLSKKVATDKESSISFSEVVENGISNEEVRKTTKSKRSTGETEGIDEFQKLADGTGKIVKVFEELCPKAKKLTQGLELASNLYEGLSVIEAASVAEGAGIIDGVSIIGEMISGMAGVASVSTMFGLPGWIVGAGLLTTGTLLSMNTQERKEIERKNEENEVSRKALETFEMTESKANSYFSQIEALSRTETHKWHIDQKPQKENIKKYGKEAYSLNNTFPSVIAYTDALTIKRNVPPEIAHISEDKFPTHSSYLEKTSPLQQKLLYIGLTDGRDAFFESANRSAIKAKERDSIRGINSFAMTQSAINEVFDQIVHMSNDGKIAAKLPRHVDAQQSVADALPINQHGSVVINLNKPMIGSFVINTRDVKEGINNFKHEVEEVLLEILNSANVIQ